MHGYTVDGVRPSHNWLARNNAWHVQQGTRQPTVPTGLIPVPIATGQLPRYPTGSMQTLTLQMADMDMGDEMPTGTVEPAYSPEMAEFMEGMPPRGFDELRRLPTSGVPLQQELTGGVGDAPMFSMV